MSSSPTAVGVFAAATLPSGVRPANTQVNEILTPEQINTERKTKERDKKRGPIRRLEGPRPVKPLVTVLSPLTSYPLRPPVRSTPCSPPSPSPNSKPFHCHPIHNPIRIRSCYSCSCSLPSSSGRRRPAWRSRQAAGRRLLPSSNLHVLPWLRPCWSSSPRRCGWPSRHH